MRIGEMARKMARHTALVRGVWLSLVAELEQSGECGWEGTAEELCRVVSCTMAEVLEFIGAAWRRGFCALSVDGRECGDGAEPPHVGLGTALAVTVPELEREAERRRAQRRRTAECRARKRDADVTRTCDADVTRTCDADVTRTCNADVTRTRKSAEILPARDVRGRAPRADVCHEEYEYNNITHTPRAGEAPGVVCVCDGLARREPRGGCADAVRPYPRSGGEVRQWIEAYKPEAATAMTPQRCQEFVDFGQATGWTVGSTPVRDWTKMISGKWLRPKPDAQWGGGGRMRGWDPRKEFSGDYSRSEGGFRLFAD